MTASTWRRENSSFRDPSGFLFWHDGTLYRQVNRTFGEEYRRLMDSGLYAELVSAGLLVPHEEVDLRLPEGSPAFTVIRPEPIPFISYPYEWCFSQLKAAALLTLDVQKRALRRGMTLRDASAYNVQFVGSRAVFIDTLSFGLNDGRPWSAYRQFCQHFLGPLALAAQCHPLLAQLTAIHMDGVPLDVVRRLLPAGTWLKPGLLLHVHLHGRAAAVHPQQNPGARERSARMTATALLGLVDSLERAVHKLSWKPPATLWSTYTDDCNYTGAAQEDKRRLVAEFLDLAAGRTELRSVWDLGANTGAYSQIAATRAGNVVGFDLDPAVVERHFQACRTRRESKVLPLVQDLANPSSATGWHHAERRSLVQRGPADAALALALVHHLAVGHNVPLPGVAAFLAELSRYLVVEFVPKEDSQVQRMLAVREDIFQTYTQAAFETAFNEHFTLVRSAPVAGTVRTVYLMERR